MKEYFTIESQEGERIDRYLAEELEDQSRSYIQKLIKEEHVLVNGKPVKANYRLLAGDNISLSLPEIKEPDIPPEKIPLDILYEDQDLLVVNKPKQMVVHPAPGHYTGTLVNALMYHCGSELSGINGVMRPGIVHRIDMDTTGSLVVCKTDAAHQCLSAQLKEHSIHRSLRGNRSWQSQRRQRHSQCADRTPSNRQKEDECPHKERKACDYPLSGTSAFWKLYVYPLQA